jgi:hypothetical protein
VDGSECLRGQVAEWESPTRLVLLWQITAEWRYDPKPATEVEIDFVEEVPGHTRLEPVHRHLERFGGQAETLRGTLGSPGGWAGTLRRFADLVS